MHTVNFSLLKQRVHAYLDFAHSLGGHCRITVRVADKLLDVPVQKCDHERDNQIIN